MKYFLILKRGGLLRVVQLIGLPLIAIYFFSMFVHGLEVNEGKRLRELEQENNTPKRLLAEKLLEVDVMKGVLSKKW